MQCNAKSSTADVLCKKDPHSDEENHWGVTADGRDVVWASVTLRPPSKEA